MDMIFLNSFSWLPLLLTAKLAFIATIILLVIGIPIAYFLAFSKSKLKPFFEALIALPLVLPPTVIGFYLLIAFSPAGGIGKYLNDWFGFEFVFSFSGLVIASVIYSFPFMVQPIQFGLQSIPNNFREAAYVLGKSKIEVLRYIFLPNCKRAIITGFILTFAHTIGEFGVVLMIGGSIPEKTKVASIVVYEQVEALNYDTAHLYSLVLLTVSFLVLLVVYTFFNKKTNLF